MTMSSLSRIGKCDASFGMLSPFVIFWLGRLTIFRSWPLKTGANGGNRTTIRKSEHDIGFAASTISARPQYHMAIDARRHAAQVESRPRPRACPPVPERARPTGGQE